MKAFILYAFLIASSAVHLAAAFYAADSPVHLIEGKEEFAAKVLKGDEVSIVEFFAPWCPHCKSLAPTVEEAAKSLEGLVPVFAVDCDEKEENKPICQEHGVSAFPTIKIFHAELKENPYTGAFYKETVDYKGKPTARAMAAAAQKLLPSEHITHLKSLEDWRKVTAEGELPNVLLLSHKAASTPLYKALSLRFKQRLAFAQAQPTAEDLKEDIGFKSAPALVVRDAEGTVHQYSGKLSALELGAFLEKFAAPKPAAAEKREVETKGSASPKRKRAFVPEKLELRDVKEKLSESEAAWLVAAFKGSNETCAEDVAAWEGVVEKLGGLTSAATIFLSSSQLQEAASIGLGASLECAAQILLLPSGDKDDQDWPVYEGELEAKELQQFVLPTFPLQVLRLTSDSLPRTLGIRPNRPKLVLFTDKDETPPIFAALAANFAPRGVDFFDVHSSEADVLAQFGVSKVPSIVLAYLPAEEVWNEGEQRRMSLQPYKGPLKYPRMAAFVESVVSAFVEAEQGRAAAIKIEDANGNQETFERNCGQKLLCIIAYLGDQKDEAEKDLEALRKAASHGDLSALHYIWVSAKQHPSLASQLGLGASEVPALVAYSGGRSRFAVLRGRFDVAEITTFLSGLMEGKTKISELQAKLTLDDPTKESESAAEETALTEEEFDLSDILSESVDAETKSKAELLADIDVQIQEEQVKDVAEEKLSKKKKRKKASKKASKKTKKATDSKSEL